MQRQISSTVYGKIKNGMLLGRLQMYVYDILYHNGPLTQMEVAKHSETMDRSSVGPRFTELKRMGCIASLGKRKCEVTGRNTNTFDVTKNLPDKSKKITAVTRKQLLDVITSLSNALEIPLSNGLCQLAKGKLSPQSTEWVQQASRASQHADELLKKAS